MESNPIEINLSVEARGEFLVAHLLFFNNTPQNYFLDRYTICFDGKFSRNVFTILDENNNKLHYTGFMVKRLIMAEHFIALEPGEALATTIILNHGYHLKKGKHYTIRYATFNPGYLKVQEYMKIESNHVEVEYCKV